MTKIPVLDTIRAAYQFTFTHLGAIIGLIWLPMILATVMGFLVLQRFYAALANALASNNFVQMGPALLGLISFVLVGLLLLAMMSVPVMQLALGSRKEGALAHFAFGPPEWRLFRAALGVTGFLFALLMILSTVVAAFVGKALLGPDVLLMGFVLYLGLIFFILRFGFFLPVVAVVETGPVLPRSWLLSAGNFWRILVVFLAVVVPARLAMLVVELAVLGPAALEPKEMKSTAMMAAQIHAAAQNMPVTAGILFLFTPLLLGLLLGAGAHAYRTLESGSSS